MLGTIEDLERDIELFRSNVAASNELYLLLSQILEQIRQHNVTFDKKSDDLLGKIETIPASVDKANTISNTIVNKNVSNEIDRALQYFSQEQDKYIQFLKKMEQQIEEYKEQSQMQAESFDSKASELVSRVTDIPSQIKADTKANLEAHRTAVDADFEKRNVQFSRMEEKYISAMEETNSKLKIFEDQLLSKYHEFLQTLEKNNLSNLYEQNQKLQTEFNKKTTILMIVSGLSIVLGILGLIL